MKGFRKRFAPSSSYTKDLGDKLTELYFHEDPKSLSIYEPGDDPEVGIVDGWSEIKRFTTDVNGFAVHTFRPRFTGPWEDEAAVRKEFYPEVVDFLQKNEGARRVEVFDHTIRTKKNNEKKLT